MATLGRALAIVSVAFQDVTDKGGRPYMEHCLTVMDAAKHLNVPVAIRDEIKIAYLMHDLVEDTRGLPDDQKWTLRRIQHEGFSDMTVRIIDAMTHRVGESYEDYIKRVSIDEWGKIGKQADLRTNMDVSRLKGLRKKDFERLEKYARAYVYLTD